MGLLDCAVLDIQTLQYKMRQLIASFMYLLLGIDLHLYSPDLILSKFSASSLYLLDQSSPFNSLFGTFLKHYFSISLEELLPCTQYASTFMGLDFEKCPYPSIVDRKSSEVVFVSHSSPLRATSRTSLPIRTTMPSL
jgi:hypothetical protein